MKISRTKAGALVLTFSAIAIVFGVLQLRRSQTDVRLILVGYTNVLIDSSASGDLLISSWVPNAIVVLTNCGNIPIKTATVWEADPAYPNSQISPALAGSYLLLWPNHQLDPATATSVVSHLPSIGSGGKLKIAYTRLDWREKFSQNARSSRHAFVRNLANKLFPIAKLHWTHSDSLTNPPPPFEPPASRFHITAPPSYIPILFPSKPGER